MNLSDSMKFVLKTKSQDIFEHLWKEDLKFLLTDFIRELKSNRNKLKILKENGFKKTCLEFKEFSVEAVTILKVVPKRVKDGFKIFRDDFLDLLEKQPDSKQKTIFCFKVISMLSRFAMGVFYGLKKSRTDSPLPGAGLHRNAFTQFLMTAIVFKMTQIFILRFLEEVEKELTDAEEVKNLKFFKNLLNDSKLQQDGDYQEVQEPGDPAYELVESLRNYILTGLKA